MEAFKAFNAEGHDVEKCWLMWLRVLCLCERTWVRVLCMPIVWLWKFKGVCSNPVHNKIALFIFANEMVVWMWKSGKTLETKGNQGSWENNP